MQASRDTGPALTGLAERLGQEAAAFTTWLQAAATTLRDRLERAVGEQAPDWTQERLTHLLQRIAGAETQLARAERHLQTRPLFALISADGSDPTPWLHELLNHHLASRILNEALPRLSAPISLDWAQGNAAMEIRLWAHDQLPTEAGWPVGATPEDLPPSLLLTELGDTDWPQLLQWPQTDELGSLIHDTHRVLDLHPSDDATGDRANRRDLACFLAGATVWLDQPAALLHEAEVCIGLDWTDTTHDGPVGPEFQRAKRDQLLRQGVSKLETCWLVMDATGTGSATDDRFQRLVWQPWCNRCGVEADPRGFAGRLGLLVQNAQGLFAHVERAPGPWLLHATDHPLRQLQDRLFNQLHGFRDRGPESWPPLVLFASSRPVDLASDCREHALQTLTDYFRSHADAPTDAPEDWEASWRSIWRAGQGLWSLPAFQEGAPRRVRAWRRLLQALLACCDPADSGQHRLLSQLQRWREQGPIRHTALTNATRALDQARQAVHDLRHDLMPRDLREFDVGRIHEAQLFLRRTNAYDPDDLGFRFGSNQAKGLAELRARITEQQGVKLPEVLQAITADAITQLPISEEIPENEATHGREIVLATVRELIGLDRCWQDFSQQYIGPKDITHITLIEASQLILQRLNAVLEWLVELAADAHAEDALQHGESGAAALDRLLRDCHLPDAPSSDIANADRELQDLVLAVHQAAEED